MATFQNKSFLKHDDYMTPKYAWENIAQFIPKDKKIWEAFYGDSKSGDYLKELGFDVIHEPIDFFQNDLGEIIVSNPPFSKCKEILDRLAIIDKPFILIMPCSKIATGYMRETFMNKLQIIVPPKRIHFLKKINGKEIDGWKNACYFDCFYYCYKIGLPKDLIFLD